MCSLLLGNHVAVALVIGTHALVLLSKVVVHKVGLVGVFAHAQPRNRDPVQRVHIIVDTPRVLALLGTGARWDRPRSTGGDTGCLKEQVLAGLAEVNVGR